MGLRSGSRRTCSTTSLQSEPVVNSPSTAFQNPGVLQFITLVINGLAIHVLNCEVGSSGAFHFVVLVIAREIVGGVGLYGDQLIHASIDDSRPVKRNRKGTMSAMRVVGVESQAHAILLLVVPIEAGIEDGKIEVAIHDQIAGRWQILK